MPFNGPDFLKTSVSRSSGLRELPGSCEVHFTTDRGESNGRNRTRIGLSSADITDFAPLTTSKSFFEEV